MLVYLYLFFHIFTRRKNKNNLREFEPQNGKKFKKTQAEFKNVVSYKKKSVFTIWKVEQYPSLYPN